MGSAGDLLTIGVVSDLHFGPRASFAGKLRKLSHLAATLTEAFVERMRAQQVDLVVNLGDVIEDVDAQTDLQRYSSCMRLLEAAGVERIHVAGNHDLVNLDAATLRKAWAMPASGVLYRSLDRKGLHLVVLHTHERKDRDVSIDAEQLSWLKQDLATTTLPTVVLMHHSAADQDLRGNRWFEGAEHICLLAQRAELRAVLARSGRVILVLNGHLHWNHFDLIDSIPYVTLQSLVENIDEDAPGRPAAAHAVLRFDGRRLLVEIAGAHPLRYQIELGTS